MSLQRLPPEQFQRRFRDLMVQEDERQHYERLVELDTYVDGVREGRPYKVFPPDIATRILSDVESGKALRAIGRKYGTSHTWVSKALQDGRLELMARGEYGEPNS